MAGSGPGQPRGCRRRRAPRPHRRPRRRGRAVVDGVAGRVMAAAGGVVVVGVAVERGRRGRGGGGRGGGGVGPAGRGRGGGGGGREGAGDGWGLRSSLPPCYSGVGSNWA